MNSDTHARMTDHAASLLDERCRQRRDRARRVFIGLTLGFAILWVVSYIRPLGDPDWPRRAAIARGRIHLLSTLWNRPPDPYYLYDRVGQPPGALWPVFHRCGDVYTLHGPRWGA